MVLENTSPPPDSFSDSPYPSDSDPYSDNPASSSSSPFPRPTSSPGASLPPIDFTQLPKPMPIMGPLLGHTQTSLQRRTLEFVTLFSNMAQRPLSSEETSALAYHGAKMRATASWGDGLGVLVGAARCWQTAGTFKFPLRKPSSRLDPEVLGPLRGGAARVGWHALRLGAYGLLGNLAVGMVVANYALAVAMVNIKVDGRLRALHEAIDRNKREVGRRERARRGLPPPPGEARGETPERRTEGAAGGSGGGAPDGQAMMQRPYDDASPTGRAADAGPWDTAYSGGAAGSSMPPVPPTRRQQQQQQQRPPWVRPVPQARTTTQRKDEGTSPFDPDSPTGGFGVFEEDERERVGRVQSGRPSRPAAAASGGEGGSVWDRVRRQAVEGSGDAQREFDERVERERRGEDFGGEERKW